MLNIEKKRQVYHNNLSLAQKLGLMQRPEQPKGLEEWHQVEHKYLERTKAENEHLCPICFEDLHIQSQTILCCSHVFH